ncbi:uncharacterized protein LOC133825573 [Humulus lupulus]|uniref:uncharacterized protein LOC133825573 n=1 Tax=Humulus lupulus TaxID=3486 RepID=UPI002B40F0B6|nr:uncharacterized protein LOC133825573 [Humulus lupulus]
MTSNPIISLLSKELLIGKDLMKWKSNINIVLIGDNSKFMMIETEPDFLRENAWKAMREKHDRWIAANNKAKAYMLPSMLETLRTKMENVENTYDIMEQFQEMFGHKSTQASFKATKKYVKCRMAPGQHVCDHFIKMMLYFHEVELHGAIVNEKTQLLNELHMYEGINGVLSKGPEKKAATTRRAQGEANLASSSKSKKRKVRKDKEG